MQPIQLQRTVKQQIAHNALKQLPLCEEDRIPLQLFQPTVFFHVQDLGKTFVTPVLHFEYAIHDGTKVIAYKLGNYVFNYSKIY